MSQLRSANTARMAPWLIDVTNRYPPAISRMVWLTAQVSRAAGETDQARRGCRELVPQRHPDLGRRRQPQPVTGHHHAVDDPGHVSSELRQQPVQLTGHDRIPSLAP